MSKKEKQLYEFGPFILDLAERQVRHGAARMELAPRAFDTLAALVQHDGQLLEKDDLMRTVWGDTFVEENNLSQVIYLLRKALRDGEDGMRYIETVPKRGYRFIAPVRKDSGAEGNSHGQPDRMPRSISYSSAGFPPAIKVGETEAVQLAPFPGAQGNGSGNGNGTSHQSTSGFRTTQGVLSVVAAVALFFLGANWKQKLMNKVEAAPIRSVAVLPLQNLSNDPAQEYFVDGMTDELITDLAQIRELKVVSKTSVMRFKGTRTPLPQIGRELGVDAVIEGSVLRSGDKVRITAQLIRTSTDHHIWAEAYDGDLKDVLSLQARVAESITGQVKLNLTADESGRLQRAHSVNPLAFDLYLHGRYAQSRRNLDGLHAAAQYFQQAIDQDPNFALAYSGLADCDTLLALFGEGSAKIAQAKMAAENALKLDDSLAEAHTSLAAVRILDAWDWRGAELEFQEALRLNPNYAQAHHWYGNLLLGPQGRHQEAIAELQRAQELDPLSAIIAADLGFAYYLAGRYDMAVPAYQKVLAGNPDFVPAHFYLAQYYLEAGQYDLWLKEADADYRLSGFVDRADNLEKLYARGGWRAILEEEASRPRRVAAYNDSQADVCESARANSYLNRSAAALTSLDQCTRRAQVSLIYLKVDPIWTNVRQDGRFQDMLRRLRLQ